MTEEEEVDAAIAASLEDQGVGAETARAIHQVEMAQVGEATRDSMLKKLPSPRAPSPPAMYRDDAHDQAMLQRLQSKAPQAMNIAKAALILRRRAASARLRVDERRRSGLPVAPLAANWPPIEGPGTAPESAHEKQIMAGTQLLAERLKSLGMRRCAVSPGSYHEHPRPRA